MKQIYHCLLLLGSILGSADLYAQSLQGGLRGKIVDVETFKPIIGASISISGVTSPVSTDEKGEFAIQLNKKGSYQVVSKFVGYAPDTTMVEYGDKSWENLSIVLVAENSAIDEVVVTRRRVQFTELALLEERRKSSLVVEKIGAEELARKGVSDAAAAVSKISGVTMQEGSSQVYVRGLGDRYMSTSLNGLPIPSSDPDLKNIDLKIFNTDIVDYVSVDKLYNASISGDFGGASVDIASKNYKGDRLFEVSIGSTVNTGALKQARHFYLQDGPDFFGFSDFSIPKEATASYHFKDSWGVSKKRMMPMDFGLRAGDSFRIGEEGRLSLFGSANYSNSYGYRNGINANVGAQGDPLKSLRQTRYSYDTKLTGIFNANYQFNNDHRLSYNLLYVNSGEQFHDNFSGFIRDAAESNNGLVRRNTFKRTALVINQLLGSHQLNEKINLDWGLGYNIVDGDMPDRTQSMVLSDPNGYYKFISVNAADNHRFTYYLKENEYVANVAASYKIGDEGRGKISVGYSGKIKKRTYDVMQINFDIEPAYKEFEIDPNDIDQYLGANGFGTFYLMQSFAGDGFQYYKGDQYIHAGFASLDYKLTERLTAVIGARYENVLQTVDYYSVQTKGKNSIRKKAFLPSLNVKYELNEKQNLRLGASKTYTLPQFKERARFPYEDVTEVIFGNPYLYPSDNYNLDLKWEMFPTASELISLTAFGKYIQNPINQIMVSSATNDISYANTGDMGYAYGGEVELKKDIVKFNNDNKLSVGFNAAIMKTHQKFDPEKVTSETEGGINIDPTHETATFSGASDYIVNADLSYQMRFVQDKELTATVLYNYYSDKIYAIGTGGLGHRVDRGVSTLDFVLKSKVSKRIGVDLIAKNLLNPEIQRWQENVIPVKILSYKKGMSFGLAVKCQF